MTAPWVCVEPLARHHDIAAFVSGRESVDAWLHGKAWSVRNLVTTHICLDGDGAVLAFFALRTVPFNASGLSSSLRSGADPDGSSVAILLAQMGVRVSDQRRGYGQAVFWEAVAKAREADAASRTPAFVVDAADEGLVGYYENLGMKLIPNTLRLAAAISKIR